MNLKSPSNTGHFLQNIRVQGNYSDLVWYVHCTTSTGSYTDISARITQHPPIYQIQNSLQLAIFWIRRKAIQRNGSSTHRCNHSFTTIGNPNTNNYENRTTHFLKRMNEFTAFYMLSKTRHSTNKPKKERRSQMRQD
jgi:hypothetical protein